MVMPLNTPVPGDDPLPPPTGEPPGTLIFARRESASGRVLEPLVDKLPVPREFCTAEVMEAPHTQTSQLMA